RACAVSADRHGARRSADMMLECSPGTGDASWRSAVTAEHPVNRLHDDADVIAGEAVIDGLALTSCLHQAVLAQPRQLLRHGRLSQCEQVLELADRALSLAQDAQDHQPVWMRHRLEEQARISGARGQCAKMAARLSSFRKRGREAHQVIQSADFARLYQSMPLCRLILIKKIWFR